MKLTYRDGNPADAATIEMLFRESFVDTFGHLYDSADLDAFLAEATVEDWREELADPDMHFRVACADGSPVGFARVGPGTMPKQMEDDPVELRQLYLLPEFRGQGIAAELMDWVIADARARGARYLYLSVYIENHRARRLYERYGFVEEGPYAFMVGNHADEDVVMRLAL
jgi:ribosomal protein S18 acetylase RimI-like enzyme